MGKVVTCDSGTGASCLLGILKVRGIGELTSSLGLTDRRGVCPVIDTLFVPVRLVRRGKFAGRRTLGRLGNVDLRRCQDETVSVRRG